MKRYKIADGAVLHTLSAFSGASAAELRVLFILKEMGEAMDGKSVAALAALSEEDAQDALSFWRGAGALVAEDAAQTAQEKIRKAAKKPTASADKLSPYSPEEASVLIEKENLASFIELCQQTYGKVLCPSDIEMLLGLHDQLQLDCEYICLLVAFCVENGRKPMRYIEKVAFSLYDRGILTVDALNDYIEKKHRQDSREGKLRRMFGIGDRALSKKEDECFLRWCEEYGYDDSVIELAFDVTVNAVGRASVPYADKILRRWHEAGGKNIFEIQELMEKDKENRTVEGAGKKKPKAVDAEKADMRSFDVDTFFAHALNRSYGADDKKDDKK